MTRRSVVIPWVIVAVLSSLLTVCVFAELDRWIKSSFVILEGRRPYGFRGSFLSEAEAMEAADHAMRLAAIDTTKWKPQQILHDGIAPDGSKDVYFSRNTLDPDTGSIMFVDEQQRPRSIHFALHKEGGNHRFSLSRGK